MHGAKHNGNDVAIYKTIDCLTERQNVIFIQNTKFDLV